MYAWIYHELTSRLGEDNLTIKYKTYPFSLGLK